MRRNWQAMRSLNDRNVATVTVLEALERQVDGHLLLDVRTFPEWTAGHMPRALPAPLAQLIDDLRCVDRDTPLVVYSQTGTRSMEAATALRRVGFTNVANMEGGFNAYQQGLLGNFDTPPPAAATSQGTPYGTR